MNRTQINPVVVVDVLKKKEGVSLLSTPGTGRTAVTASCRPFSFHPSSPFFLLEV
jgi:hypothetical protein